MENNNKNRNRPKQGQIENQDDVIVGCMLALQTRDTHLSLTSGLQMRVCTLLMDTCLKRMRCFCTWLFSLAASYPSDAHFLCVAIKMEVGLFRKSLLIVLKGSCCLDDRLLDCLWRAELSPHWASNVQASVVKNYDDGLVFGLVWLSNNMLFLHNYHWCWARYKMKEESTRQMKRYILQNTSIKRHTSKQIAWIMLSNWGCNSSAGPPKIFPFSLK